MSKLEHPLSPESLEWVRDFITNTINEDFLSKYQLELVGKPPQDVIDWCDLDNAFWAEFEEDEDDRSDEEVEADAAAYKSYLDGVLKGLR